MIQNLHAHREDRFGARKSIDKHGGLFSSIKEKYIRIRQPRAVINTLENRAQQREIWLKHHDQSTTQDPRRERCNVMSKPKAKHDCDSLLSKVNAIGDLFCFFLWRVTRCECLRCIERAQHTICCSKPCDIPCCNGRESFSKIWISNRECFEVAVKQCVDVRVHRSIRKI